MDILDLVWATDENYVFLAGVSMTSVFENNKDYERIRVWILEDHLSSRSKEKLRECAKIYNRECYFINLEWDIDRMREMGAVAWGANSSYSAYSRIFMAGELFRQGVHKVIYCDCDLIINGSIRPVMEYDLGEKTIGLVKDYNRVEIRELLDLPLEASYYNTGFLLMNVDRWIERKCKERILTHMENVSARYPFVDQDLINCVLHEEIMTLPMKYNVNPRAMQFSYDEIKCVYGMNETNYYDATEYEMTNREKPVVYHCSDPAWGKPWEYGNRHIYCEIWLSYFKKSLWADEYQMKKSMPNRISKLQHVLYFTLPRKVYIKVLSNASRNASKKCVKYYMQFRKNMLNYEK